MSPRLRYDFYFISKLLLEKGAEREVWDWNCGLSIKLQVFQKIPIKVENADGCKAILGISGSKEGAEADVQFFACAKSCLSVIQPWRSLTFGRHGTHQPTS